ncbi:MAG: HAD family hydrolase [Akkermansiaceae bacterium]
MSKETQAAIQEAKAVLFDFDGVILDTEWPIYQTWKNLYETEGQNLEPEIYVRCIGSDFDTWSPQTYLEELTGKTFDWNTINPQRQVKLEADLQDSEPMAGVRELLESLSEKKTAVVSSSSHHWVDAWVEKLNLLSYFETLVCRGDAPKIKPAPDLYIEAARQLDVAPADCLVIEDSLNGMIAAHTAGMKTLIVPNRLTAVLDFSKSDLVVDSLQSCLDKQESI